MSTFAGSTQGLAEGNGAAARFDSPNGIDVDYTGNVYVADAGNHRIRKITPAGVVSTFAGSAAGFADGGPGEAKFSGPYGVAVALDGVVYVADTGNHRIRRISPEGQVTTIAGGSEGYQEGVGAVARFKSPFSVAIDEAGNVYVADAGNHAIRKISPAADVTTLAGGSSGRQDGPFAGARFFVPNDLAFDPARNLFVADFQNHQVRKIDFALREVATAAGTGTSGATDGAKAQANLNLPTGLAIDGQGVVFIADNGNHRLRTATTEGVVATFAGSRSGYQDGSVSQALFNEPTDLAIDRAGTIYVADTMNHRIRKIVR